VEKSLATLYSRGEGKTLRLGSEANLISPKPKRPIK
jgi:hypothetical protein